jgi:hypothetical protein
MIRVAALLHDITTFRSVTRLKMSGASPRHDKDQDRVRYFRRRKYRPISNVRIQRAVRTR